MKNLRTAFNDDDPRRVWVADLGDQWQGPNVRSKHEHRDPREVHVCALKDAWKQGPGDDDDDEDNASEYNDAVRFRDAMSFDAAIPSGLPTGTTLRLMREQRHKLFGGAA